VNFTGCFLDVSMLETALTAMGWVVSEHLIAGRIAERFGNDNAASSPSGTFQTGQGLLNIAANTQKQFESVCEVCDRVDLISDSRFISRVDRKQHRSELTVELETALRTRSADEWEELFAEASVPAGCVLTLEEALNQEQVRERELLHDVEVSLPERRTVTVLGSGVHVDGKSLAPSMPPPRLGQHTEAILTELGFSSEEIEALRHEHAV
jgi:crotonobetainyl-CoA:carnitine CoA-transferase CaiB-like acyl-CoA transferase